MLASAGLLTVASLSACGKQPQPKPEVEFLDVYAEDDYGDLEEEVLVGGYLWLVAELDVPEGVDDSVTWASSNEDILLVQEHEQYGYYVVGTGVGTATLTATSVANDEVSASFELDAVRPYVRSVSLDTTGVYLVLGGDYAEHELEADVTTYGEVSEELTYTSDDETVAEVEVDDEGNAKIVAVAEGQTVIHAVSSDEKASASVAVTVKPAGSKLPADGAFSYVRESNTERTGILGKLEKYAVDNRLTGLTLFGNGGYVMYSPDVQKGADSFIPGFGFGIASSGNVTADLAKESKAEWKRYYHTFESSDPANLNYMDDKGAVVGDLIGFVNDTYFATYINENKDGYDWVGSLAKVNRPIPVNEENGVATKFKFPVKTGSELKYRTLSTTFSSYNNREVAIEDYITPWQIYFTKAYNLARSAENLEGAGSIKGAKNYYDKSANGFNATEWENVGVKAIQDPELGACLEFEFNQACTPFYAMYYLASSMYAPIPEAFIKALGNNDLAAGVKLWGRFSSDNNWTPVDTWLSTGPFVVEQWDYDQQIAFKKNENFDDKDGKYYKIPGYHFNILKAAAQDPEAAFNEFLDGKLHSVGIPSTKLDEYRNDPRSTMTSDDSTFKLNLNTCDQETWEALFGINGSIAQTPKSQYWTVKPAMSNKNFTAGLNLAINRLDYANKLGRTPSANYFASAYLSDPENGISYNTTEAHANAVDPAVIDPTKYGYDLEKAKAYFKAACDELIANGSYKRGDTIKIEIAWQTFSQETTYHNPLKKYIEDAFNACGGGLTLELSFWASQTWSDVYYAKMMVGQFDIGFGSISGNTYDPLNFLEVLKSDNSSGFTLNWGLDTNAVDGSIEYKDKVWSFDALWTAADQGAYVEAGANAPIVKTAKIEKQERQADGSLVITVIAYEQEILNEAGTEVAIATAFSKLVMYGYIGGTASSNYFEIDSGKPAKSEDQTKLPELPEGDNGKYTRYTVTFSAADCNELEATDYKTYAAMGGFGYDLYFVTTFFGAAGDPAFVKTIAVVKTGMPDKPAN